MALEGAAREEGKILHKFIVTRANLEKIGVPMTGAQRSGALALLADAKAIREAASTLVDETFVVTTKIEPDPIEP